MDFAEGNLAVSQNWDRFHQSFDDWRESVISCDPRSVESALRTFAGRSLGITQGARHLIRPSSLRSTADEAARSEARIVRDQAAVSIAAWRDSISEPVSTQVDSFFSMFQSLDSDWDQFHRDYDAFRVEQNQLSGADSVSCLSDLLANFGNIVGEVGKLPSVELTREIADRSAEVAEVEQLGLRRLASAIGSVDAETGQVSSQVDGEAEGDEETNSGALGNSGFALNNPSLFDVFDTQVTNTNLIRRQLRQELGDLMLSLTEQGQKELVDFSEGYNQLEQDWDALNSDHDDWRRTDGRCDRARALADPVRLTNEFAQIVSEVGALPSSLPVRAVSDLLAAAAEREFTALVDLRDTWRALDAGVYQDFELSCSSASKFVGGSALASGT